MAKAHGGVYSIAIDIWVTWEGRIALVYVYSCRHNCDFRNLWELEQKAKRPGTQ